MKNLMDEIGLEKIPTILYDEFNEVWTKIELYDFTNKYKIKERNKGFYFIFEGRILSNNQHFRVNDCYCNIWISKSAFVEELIRCNINSKIDKEEHYILYLEICRKKKNKKGIYTKLNIKNIQLEKID